MDTPFPEIPPVPGYAKHSNALTPDQQLRSECVEWLTSHAMIDETCAKRIMEHCFGVALVLLKRSNVT